MFSSLSKKIERLRKRITKKGKSDRARKRDIKIVQSVHGRKFPRLDQFLHIRKVTSRAEYITLLVSTGIFIISSVWFFVGLANSYRTEIAKAGGEYHEGIVGSPQLINPLFSSLNDVDRDLTTLLFSGLMRYDENRNLVPDLAESFQISEDKKTYTFELRENLTWHDGEPMTASDVFFTIQTLQDIEVASPLRVSFQGVSMEQLDERRILFRLDEPFQSFLATLTVGIIPEHLWSTISPEAMRLAGRNLKPVGSGPFMFKRLIKDPNGVITRVELARNESYYQDPTFLDELHFVFFQDYEGPAGAIQALRQQKVDGLHFIPFDLREKVQRKHTLLKTLHLPQYSALFFNQDNSAALKDKNVRTALAEGLDRDRILNETLSNEGAVIYGPILNGFPGFDSEFRSQSFSITEANELLDESWTRVDADTYLAELKDKILEERLSGLTTSSTEESELEELRTSLSEEIDGELQNQINEAQLFFRKNKAGEILEFDIVTADTAEYRKASKIISGAWQELGIKTRITFIPPKDITREILRERNYDILLYGVIVGNDPDQYPFWHSSQVDYPGLNLSRYINRSVDTILEDIRETDDEAVAAPLYAEFQTKVTEDIPAIFLYSPTYTYVLTDKVQGFDIQHISHPSDRFADVTSWYTNTKHVWNFSK